MTPRRRYNFFLDDELREGLQLISERDGVLESEQIRRAIRMWLESKGVRVKKTERKRPSTRKRS